MPSSAILSYDGTDNDADAVALGRLLRRANALDVALAYVRHAPEAENRLEVVERQKAARLLDAGAALLGPPEAERHVVLSASTPEGLAMLAADLGADLIVFGSEYRTPEGHVQPGASAQRLLDGGTTAIAVAPAGMRDWRDAKINELGSVGYDGGEAAAGVAASLAGALGGEVSDSPDAADVLVLGSRPDGPPGQIQLEAAVRQRLEEAPVPVLVLPVGSALIF
jgi:nucleotide-binding universal stress UspA family protein